VSDTKTISIGFPATLLTVSFIVLKLVGIISWPWFIVFMPLIIIYGVLLLFFVFIAGGVVLCAALAFLVIPFEKPTTRYR
jgi:hypothetical protein